MNLKNTISIKNIIFRTARLMSSNVEVLLIVSLELGDVTGIEIVVTGRMKMDVQSPNVQLENSLAKPVARVS